jgi:basic amino acid/polyamine antiporter, APA family
MTELKRTLGLAECIFFGVGSILGAGIYALVGKVAGVSGNLIWLSFLIASITALFTAFSYAELSSAFPKAGGEYEYAKHAFGKKVGFFLGALISINGIISGATVSLGFAGYLSGLIGINLIIAALGIIIVIFFVNVYGIRESSFVNIIFTLLEASGLLLVIYCAIPHFGKVNYFELPPSGISGVLTASALAFYAYIGFEDIVKLAEETKNPEKTIPRALFGSSFIVIILYTLVAVSVVSVIPYEQLGVSKNPLAGVVKMTYGQAGVVVISIIALFSTSNTILSNMLSSSRVLLNMSKEARKITHLSYISHKRQTPVKALILILIVMMSFATIGKIVTVAMIANIFIFITFLIVNVAVITLRIRNKTLERPFKIPGNVKNIPVISVLGIVMTFCLFLVNFYNLIF